MSTTPRTGSVFVGRDAETTALRAALDDAAAGRGRFVVVSGEPGIGKTSLVRRFADEARARATVAWGHAVDLGAAPAYWPFVAVLRRALDGLDAAALALDPLVGLLPELSARLPSPRPPPADAGRARYELFDAVTRTLHAAARQRPLAVLLDDAHAADPATLELLRFVARASATEPLLIVATRRSVDLRATPEAVDALHRLDREATILPLAPLPSAAIRAMADALGVEAPEAVIDTVAGTSGGNPLFADALLRAAAAGSRRLPGHLAGMLSDRLAQAPASARAVLAVVAVSGRPVTLPLVAGALDLPLTAVVEGAREALREALLAETDEAHVDLAHPLFREVLLGDLPPAEAARAHAALARAVARIYGDDETHAGEVARHLLAAARHDPSLRAEAIAVTRRAAAHAMRLAAFEDAVRLLRGALAEAGPPSGEALPLRLQLAEAALAAGEPEVAREAATSAGRLADAARDVEASARAALLYARTVEFGLPDPEKFRRLEVAVAALGDTPSALACRARGTLALELWCVPGESARRDALSAEALSMARSLGSPELLAFALAARIQARWGPGAVDERRALTEEFAALALRSPDPEARLEAHRSRLNLLVQVGDLAAARAVADEYARLAASLRRPQLRYNALIRLGLFPTLTGDLAAIAAGNAEALAAGVAARDPQAETIYASQEVLLGEEMRDPDRLRMHLPTLERDAARVANLGLYGAIALRGRLALGETARARADLDRLLAGGLEAMPEGLFTLAAWCLLAESVVALGDRERAEGLVRLLAPYARMHAAIGATYSFGSAARYLGLCRELAGDVEGAREAFESALAANEALGATRWSAYTKADLARVLAARDPSRSRSLREEARRTARSLGLARLLASLEPETVVGAPRTATLVCEGAVWRVADGERVARVRDQVGLRHVARLVSRPGEPVHAVELALGGDVEAGAAAARGGTGPALDGRAKRQYRERLAAIEGELEEARGWGDAARERRLRAELDALAAELTRAVGLGGRDRAQGSPAERCRVRVTKAIQRAVTAVGAELPSLGAHLAASLRTGTLCVYAPAPGEAPAWTLDHGSRRRA